MTIDQTDQGDQHVMQGAERLTERQMIERRMTGRKQPTTPQKSFQSTDLFAGRLPPKQEGLF